MSDQILAKAVVCRGAPTAEALAVLVSLSAHADSRGICRSALKTIAATARMEAAEAALNISVLQDVGLIILRQESGKTLIKLNTLRMNDFIHRENRTAYEAGELARQIHQKMRVMK